MQNQYSGMIEDQPTYLKKQRAYKFISSCAQKYPGQIALICLGPFTNLALAYQYKNTITNKFTNISIMGLSESLTGLNEYYVSEFNSALDPQSSYIVFKKFKNLIVSTLDTALFAQISEETLSVFLNKQTQKGLLVNKIYSFQQKNNQVPLIGDPIAVFALFRPEAISQAIQTRMNIFTKGRRSRGCSIINFFSEKSQSNIILIKRFKVKELIKDIEDSYIE